MRRQISGAVPNTMSYSLPSQSSFKTSTLSKLVAFDNFGKSEGIHRDPPIVAGQGCHVSAGVPFGIEGHA